MKSIKECPICRGEGVLTVDSAVNWVTECHVCKGACVVPTYAFEDTETGRLVHGGDNEIHDR